MQGNLSILVTSTDTTGSKEQTVKWVKFTHRCMVKMIKKIEQQTGNSKYPIFILLAIANNNNNVNNISASAVSSTADCD